MSLSLDERRRLCEAHVTLNDRPAFIAGAALSFAHVVDSETGLSAEWAWETVARIVRNGGKFHT